LARASNAAVRALVRARVPASWLVETLRASAAIPPKMTIPAINPPSTATVAAVTPMLR
jgi:hypothetical protein